MAKRKLTSLRSVLLRYLLLCGGGCALILVLWWGIFMRLIDVGFLLPAVASAQACANARETVAAVTAETFDSNQISDLCRWAVVQDGTVLQTNMTTRQLKIALNTFHGGSGNLGYTQYQYDVKMADGSFCLLQYNYAVPYADPAAGHAAGFPDLLYFAAGGAHPRLAGLANPLHRARLCRRNCPAERRRRCHCRPAAGAN